MKKLLLVLLLIFSSVPVMAWPTGFLEETVILPGADDLPSECTNNQIYIDTDATSGQRMYLCEDGSWVQQAGGGSFDGSLTSDLEAGNTPYSIDGGTSGLKFDPDNDSTDEIFFSTAGYVGIGASEPSVALDVVGDVTATGSITGNSGINSGAATDPSAVFNVSTAGDNDWWIAVISDNDGVADDSDDLKFGLGTTPGTSTMVEFNPSGAIVYGDGTSASTTVTFNGQGTSYDPRWVYSWASANYGTLRLDQLGTDSDNSTRYNFEVDGALASAFTSNIQKINFRSNGTLSTTSSNPIGIGLKGEVTMTNTSGTQGTVMGVRGRVIRNGSGGTTTTGYGIYAEDASIVAGALTNDYALGIEGRERYIVDSDTIADSGDGNPATATLNPSSGYVELTCSDGDGCTITMGETGVLEGTPVIITNISANACNFADTSGVSELAGAFAMGQYDVLEIVYTGDRWVEMSRSDN